jgi:hypothetical protein
MYMGEPPMGDVFSSKLNGDPPVGKQSDPGGGVSTF